MKFHPWYSERSADVAAAEGFAKDESSTEIPARFCRKFREEDPAPVLTLRKCEFMAVLHDFSIETWASSR